MCRLSARVQSPFYLAGRHLGIFAMDCFAELFYGSFGMATLIQKVARLAHQTFQQYVSKDKQFVDNLHKLKLLTNQVRKADVCLTPELLGLDQDQSVWTEASGEAPVSYIEIFENEIFTLGIFVLKNGARIPLHDHPDMYGLVKVLHGRVQVQSYTRIAPGAGNVALAEPPQRNAIRVTKFPPCEFSDDNEPCCLTPEDANYHEIKAVGGVAAFLDILAPPYDHDVRECHFFREVKAEQNAGPQAGTSTFLIEIPSPEDYWSNNKPYDGPEVDF